MRGKRMATPDLCRVEIMDAVESHLEDQCLFHLAHRAETGDGVVADPAVQLAQLFIGEAEIGLADGEQFTALPEAEGVVRIE